MRQSMLSWKSILLMIFIYTNTISAQDTLLLHYADATISEVILDDSANGAITGKGDDVSQGKYMFFDSWLHKSPETQLVSVLMDLEVSNFSELDSFSVFIQRSSGEYVEDLWEKKFSYSEVAEESMPISSNDVATYNFQIDMFDEGIFGIGSLYINVGIRYDNNTDAKIALRATGEGEFPEAESRCFTITEDGNISDFVSAYGAEVGLAIFPVTFLSLGTADISNLGLEVINTGDGSLIVNSTHKSSNVTVSLLGLDGQLLYVDQLQSSRTLQIDTNYFPSGIYILNASNGSIKGSVKVFLP